MRVKFSPDDVMYTSEKKVLNDMTLALPSKLKHANTKENYEAICDDFNLKFSEIDSENIFFVVKKLRSYGDDLSFIGCGEVQFVFQDFKLKEINASVLFTGENKKKHPYVEQKMFIEKYFHSRERVVELLKENRNIKKDLNDMQDGIYFDKEKREFEYDLMNLVKDINALKEKEIHIKRVLSTLFYLSSIGDYVLNLNIDDLYHRDYLTITNKNNARGMGIGAKKINKASFRKNKNDEWYISSIYVSDKGIKSNYIIEDEIKAFHEDFNFSFFSYNTSFLSKSEMNDMFFRNTTIVFNDEIQPTIKKVILPKIFSSYGFKRVVNANENLDEQFGMFNKTQYTDNIYGIMCYLRETKKELSKDLKENNLTEDELNLLIELNINNDELDDIKKNFLLIKEIYKVCEKRTKKLIKSPENLTENPVNFMEVWTKDIEKVIKNLL